MTNRSSGTSQRQLARVVAYGKVRIWVLVALLGGVAVIAAFAAGRRAGPGDGSGAQAATRGGSPATVASSMKTYTAPANDSLPAAIFDSSTAVLAPGATLSIGAGYLNPKGFHQWDATLSGEARITIGGGKKSLLVQAAAGKVLMDNGTYDVNATPTLVIVHTIAGNTAWLYQSHGIRAMIPRHVPVDDVGTTDASQPVRRFSKSQ